MKCLLINGGPRTGNTYALYEVVKSRMAECGDVVFEEIHLGKRDIPLCRGCFACFKTGEENCPHHSEVGPIADTIASSDCVIMICPTYSLALTAHMKNLLDHLSYFFHRPRFYDKKALVMSTTAGAGARGVTKYIRDVLKHWGFGRVYTYALACRTDHGYKPTPKVAQKLSRIAKTFYDDVAGGRLVSPSPKRVMYYNIWRGMANIGLVAADHAYWKEHGMLDTMYHPPVRLGPFKRLFGKMFFAMSKKMVK